MLVVTFNRLQVDIGRAYMPRSLYRDHSFIACSRHIYMGVILRAHCFRGESHIQHDTNGEVATVRSIWEKF